MIHVCMTASLRAETIARTLDSFMEYVRIAEDVHWLVNVDPAGDGTQADVIYEFEKRGLDATFNLPDKANLNAALRWCYRAVESGPFYFTEDDVEYRAPFELGAAFDEFHRHDRLAYLAVPRCPFPKDDVAGIENGPTVGPITWRDGRYKMCLGPGLLSTEYTRRLADLMADYPDPEIQFHARNPEMVQWVDSWRFATYSAGNEAHPGCGSGCRHPIWDIGRAYRDQRGIKWVQTPEGTVWQRA